jgi:hypothetical protein
MIQMSEEHNGHVCYLAECKKCGLNYTNFKDICSACFCSESTEELMPIFEHNRKVYDDRRNVSGAIKIILFFFCAISVAFFISFRAELIFIAGYLSPFLFGLIAEKITPWFVSGMKEIPE